MLCTPHVRHAPGYGRGLRERSRMSVRDPLARSFKNIQDELDSQIMANMPSIIPVSRSI